MKRSLLVSLILLGGTILTACGKSGDNTVYVNNNVVINNNATDNGDDATNLGNGNLNSDNNCEKTVQKYLDGTDKQGQGEAIKEGDNIVVDYIGRLEDGTVFDTSIKSIAEACGKYNEARDYTEGLSFEVGTPGLIEGFNEGVIGMKLGQTNTVQFGPEKGYGEYDESRVVKTPIDEVGDISQFSEGDTVYVGMGYPAKITKITDKEVTFDMNSELAGKDLIFDITIKAIN